MASVFEAAALSAYVYNDQRGGGQSETINRMPLPTGWKDAVELGFSAGENLNTNPFSFTAGAYINKSTGEIVIAYKGTDFLVEFSGRAWNTVADLVTDAGLAIASKSLGLYSLQQLAASTFYLAVKDWAVENGYGSYPITFTGHSLGGGLASNMAVWFDRPATTFAEAPFELSACNPAVITTAAAMLTAQAGLTASQAVLSEILKLTALGNDGVYVAREGAVHNVYVKGEFLQYLRGVLPTVVGTDTAIPISDQSIRSGLALHSMNLHAAFLFNDTLRDLATKIPELIPAILSKSLHNFDPNSPTRDLITSLVGDQIRQGLAAESALTRFTQDISALQGSEGVAVGAEMRAALIAAVMDYHYYADPTSPGTLLIHESGAIHLDLGRIQSSLLTSTSLLAAASMHAIEPVSTEAASMLGRATAWHVQTGGGSMIWNETDSAIDAAIGGPQPDVLRGGTGSDVLISGNGDDVLEGGAADDALIGGNGLDRYEFFGVFGHDRLTDADGLGVIVIDGNAVSGGNKLAPNLWTSDDHRTRFALLGGDLVITYATAAGNSSNAGSITVHGWQPGQLGITLSTEEATPPPVIHDFSGDYAKQTNGANYVLDAGNYASAGPAANTPDVLVGTVDADRLQGGGGNDGLAGGAGDDSIEGGIGDDLLLGGAGADTLMGGAGNDEILGSMDGPVGQPSLVNFTPPSSFGHPEIARGFSWVLYDPEDGGDLQLAGAGLVVPNGEMDGNIIDGGAGNDRIGAGTGADLVHGGEDDDVIVGMGGSDVLFGDEGADAMLGDGYPGANGWQTEAGEHAGDYMDGGSGNDAMAGQGGADVMFGDDGDDLMYGDDRTPERTAIDIHGDDYVDGEAGNDTIVGGGRNDQLFGGDGNDQLSGDDGGVAEGDTLYLPVLLHGNDYIDGEAGDDVLMGEGGDDELVGGEGTDTLLGDTRGPALAGTAHGNDYLDGGDGNDSMAGQGGADELFGGAGDDTMSGDDATSELAAAFHGNDYVDGEGGNDSLAGGGGADSLIGGDGNDKLFGDGDDVPVANQGNDLLDAGAGNDTLRGYGGADDLEGGDGDDLLFGDAGNDFLAGGAGNDQLQGGAEADVLYGNAGDDLLAGDAGDDNLSGGEGNDELQGGEGADVLAGDSGNDTLFGLAGDDMLDGGEGDDTVQGGEGKDTLVGGGADWLLGEAGDDRLVGDGSSAVFLMGGEGNDYLSGGHVMLGGEGDDTLAALAGATYEGGAGNDTYQFDMGLGSSLTLYGVNDTLGANHIEIDGAAANVTLTTSAPFVAGQPMDLTALRINTGNGSIDVRNWLAGAVASVEVNGVAMSGADFFGQNFIYALNQTSSTAGATLQGGKQADAITATGGNSTLAGGAGADTLTGSGGNNTYKINALGGSDTITDTSAAGQGGTIAFGAGLLASDLHLSTESGALVLTFGPDTANAVRITGFDANNAQQSAGIAKFQFADGTTLTHGELVARGFDITGTQSGETLRGTNLADRMTGGAGADTLSGGGGADTYTFNTGDGADVIADADSAAGTGDVLVFGAGIAPSQIVGIRSGNDATLFIQGTNDSITLKNYFAGGADAVEQIRFADGTQWSAAQVQAAIDIGNSTDFTLHGDDNNNTLTGMGGNDALYGEGGWDLLQAGPGNDTLDGGADVDTLMGGAGSDLYICAGGEGNVDIVDEAGGDVGSVDTIRFTTLASTDAHFYLSGSRLEIASGTTTHAFVDNQFAPDAAGRIELFEFADGVTLTAQQVQALALAGTMQRDFIIGTALADSIGGNFGADVLAGGEGNDSLHGDAGFDSLAGEAGNDSLLGDAGDDTLSGGDGNDFLDGGAGWDRLDGGAGNDSYAFGVGSGMDIVTGDASGIDTVQLAAGIAAANVTLYRVSSPPAADIAYAGDSLVIQLNGSGDQLWIANYFGSGANTIESIRFADGTAWDAAAIISRLVAPASGGTANTQTGSTKANTFTIDHWSDVVSDPSTTDADIANASVSWRLPASVSVLNLTGTLNLFAVGGDASDRLTGNAGDNRFVRNVDEAGAYPGNDTLAGGAGNDVYVLTASNTVVQPDADPLARGGGAITEAAGAGTDTLMTGYWSASLADLPNVENLIAIRPNATAAGNYFYFNAGAPSNYTHQFTGNALGNVVDVSQYEDLASAQAWFGKRGMSFFASVTDFRLDGGAGADTLVGGRWADTYVVDNAGDTVVELGVTNDGKELSNDTVETPFATSLATQFAHIENITLTGSAAVNATGNAQANMLDGSKNGAANVLTGGAGDDTYIVGAGDTVRELAGEGSDTVVVAAAVGTARLADYANVENIRLQSTAGGIGAEGNADANSVTGNASSNVLAGLGGDDMLVDQRIEDATYYGGPQPVQDNDLLDGGAGNDTLESWAGADTFAGGAGDDRYLAHMANRSVTVTMALGGGIDTLVQDAGQAVNVTVQLAAGIRQGDVQLTSANGVQSVILADGSRFETSVANTVTLAFQDGVRFDGTAGADLLIGGASNDTLLGGAGNDTLAGGRGADLYVIAPGTGKDVIDDLYTGSGYASEDGKFDLVQLTGVQAANVAVWKQVTGTAATGLVLQFGSDSVTLAQSYAASGAIEAVRFDNGTQWDLATLKTLVAGTIGSAGSDTLTGGAGNDILDGAGGNDSMAGGAGNDTYHVDRAGDIVTEASGAGTDTAIAWFDGYVLPANVERGQLGGTGAFKLTGNTLANTLTGNAGDNRLDGAAGSDTMAGGAGNDTYVADVTTDVITEGASEGWDTLETALAFTLPANVEVLRMTGTGKIAGTGNAGNNAIIGNAGNNTVNGGAGHDLLQGAAGNDTLTDTSGNGALDGGTGNDVLTSGAGNDFLAGGTGTDTITFGAGADLFAFNRGDGADAINAPTAGAGQGEANDTISLGHIRLDEIRLSRETSDLVLKVNGTADALRLKGWYTAAANQTVVNLQVVVDSATDYAPATNDLLRNSKVTVLDFKELVGLYDTARAVNTSLVNWQPTESQLQAALLASSNTQAYGGIDAYSYAKDGSLANVNLEAAVNQMTGPGWGAEMQGFAVIVGMAQAVALEV